jgi:NAD+ kinase
MRTPFREVAIFGKRRAESARAPLQSTLREIAVAVESAGARPLFEEATREAAGLDEYPGLHLEALGARADVAVVLGGDGTMLGVAREMAAYDVPLIGINHGRLGFITDIAVDQMSAALATMLAGNYEADRRVMLAATIRRDGLPIYEARAVNDVVVSRGTAGGMVEFTVRVDGATMYTQRADGVILATPTGSTAYALSANGPILHPSLSGLVLAPLAPQTLSNRPITLPDSVTVEIELMDMRDASAHFDMQPYSPLLPGDVVQASRCKDAVTLLHPIGYDYYDTLRQKLHWNVMPTEPRASRAD